SIPPVSITLNEVDNHSASAYMRSLVTPGESSTIEILSPTNRLKIVDFPTFGLPTIATIAFLMKGTSFLRMISFLFLNNSTLIILAKLNHLHNCYYERFTF